MARAVAERQLRDRANVGLELVDRAGGLRPVARIVHARRDLVHDEPFGGDEQLHAHRTDIVEPLGDADRDPPCLVLDLRAQSRRHGRAPQYAVLVHVAGGIIGDGRAIRAAHDDHRTLRAKGEPCLGNEVASAERHAGGFRFLVAHLGRQHGLPLAVIAEPPRLEHDGTQQGPRFGQIRCTVHREVRRDRKSHGADGALLLQPVLRDGERAGGRGEPRAAP